MKNKSLTGVFYTNDPLKCDDQTHVPKFSPSQYQLEWLLTEFSDGL